MTPITKVRPATDADEVRGHVHRGRFTKRLIEITQILNTGQDAVVEIKLETGEKKESYISGLYRALHRSSEDAEVHRLKPGDGQPEDEIRLLVRRRGREQE